MADFAYGHPETFKKWKEESNSIICLGVKDEEELNKYFLKFKEITPSVIFREPDINNEATSVCLYGTSYVRKRLKQLPLLGKKKETFEDAILKMSNTPQSSNQSVLEHGISVLTYFNNIRNNIINDPYDDNLKIPEHLKSKKFLNYLLDDDIISNYLLFHDIGKPYCITWNDENKKFSFPDHANISSNKFLELSTHIDKEQISKLILHDMDFHLLKPNQVEDFIKNTNLTKSELYTLLYACLSELNSNAVMFGGYDSVSFKIKYKNFEKISKKIINYYENLQTV